MEVDLTASKQGLAPECWIEECRKALLESEKHNLRTRALYWTQIVNQKTKEFNAELNIELNVAFKSFEYAISNPITSHLNYLITWKGLRSEKMTVMPQRYQEFEFKAKNWVCGRRAPNYANTLFPQMIVHAERYAHEFAVFLFKDCRRIQKLYELGLMFGYLSSLCSSKITLNDRSKKTYLMFENSLKKDKNPTVQLLQKYAIDMTCGTNQSSSKMRFPNSLQSAYQYYDMRYKRSIYELREPILALHQQRQPHVIPTDEKELYALIHNLLYLQRQQQSTMHHLTSRIRQLENALINNFNIDLRSQQPMNNTVQSTPINMNSSNVVFVPMNTVRGPGVNNVFAMISN
eukprot:196235_1